MQAATRAITAPKVAAIRFSAPVLLAPEPHLLLLRATDSEFLHLLVGGYFSFRELASLAEENIEAQAQKAYGHNCQNHKKQLPHNVLLRSISK